MITNVINIDVPDINIASFIGIEEIEYTLEGADVSITVTTLGIAEITIFLEIGTEMHFE